MKIYFAGSIRGGRADVGLYHRMIEYLKRDYVVLTEHVGDLSLQEAATDVEIQGYRLAAEGQGQMRCV